MTGELVPRPERERGASAYLGGGVVQWFGKPSTRTRLHELGHKTLGHEPCKMTLTEFIDKELDAEEFSYRHMDKRVTHRIGAPIAYELVEDWGLSPKASVTLVVRRLRRRGIKVDRSALVELRGFAEGDLDVFHSITSSK